MTKEKMIENITTLFGSQCVYTYQMKDFCSNHKEEYCIFLYRAFLSIRCSELHREMKKVQEQFDELQKQLDEVENMEFS